MILQAKAALFAGGCFCDASDDFPLIFLEMLLNLMTSCEILPPVKLAAAHVYAKLGNSYSTATKSYKVLPFIIGILLFVIVLFVFLDLSDDSESFL